MSRRAAAALIASAAVIALLGTLWLVRARRAIAPVEPERLAEPAPTELLSPPESRRVTLWLPAAAGRLGSREIELTSAPEPKPRLAALLAELFAASDDGTTTALFPAPVAAAAAVTTVDGTLFLDLRAADGGPPPGAGSTLETQRIYAIVHTVLRNEPRIERVVLLWNGVQRESLSGHVDTARPLVLRPELEQR